MEGRNDEHRRLRIRRREEMLIPEDVARMLALHKAGWGSKRIARELGVARNTVKRYLAAGGYVPYRAAKRPGKLAGQEKVEGANFIGIRRLRCH